MALGLGVSMSIKPWVYDTLTNPDNLALYEAFAKRVFALESLTSAVVSGFPYLMYGLGVETPEDLAEDDDHIAERLQFRVWIHDQRTAKGGSYTKVNEGIPLVKAALKNGSNTAANITLVRYLGASEELSDEALKTVYRYLDFEAVIGKGN